MRHKSPMDKYLIADPWPTRVREALARIFVCSWRGHARPKAFGGGTKPCNRCSR